MALAAIWANKLRSFLTVSGIVIGVAVVIAVEGIIQGLTGTSSTRSGARGEHAPRPGIPPAGKRAKLARIELTVEDADAIRQLCGCHGSRVLGDRLRP
jgi:hypothetical protein